jgi:mannose-6-phosphate isomerase
MRHSTGSIDLLVAGLAYRAGSGNLRVPGGSLPMDWYPLKLTYHVRSYAFGDRLIVDMLGKQDAPDGIVAETWEISDHRDAQATVTNGAFAGASFHDLVMTHPDAVVGAGWSGPHFPLLGKFLDALHPLPVHLHADDETARRVYGEPHGKSEAWHILWAAPEASILAGVNPELSHDELFEAFKRRDYDSVMYRYPITPGDTVYVPGGILHAFGPDTLIFEIQQTSDLGQTVMPTDLFGEKKSPEQWDDDIRKTLAELKTDYFPKPNPGLTIERGGNRYTIGCAGPYFALERWNLQRAHHQPSHDDRCFTISNTGDTVAIRFSGGEELLERAQSCVIPAALGEFEIAPLGQSADLIVCFVPDLERDIVGPLREAKFEDAEIAALGVISAG